MAEPDLVPAAGDGSISLVCRRLIAAPPEACFAAWTEPEQLRRWWGPGDVRCSEAEVDLRVGGTWRIANQHPDGSILWICGRFEMVERPERLVYSWAHEPVIESEQTRVSVRFEGREGGTEVIVVHERFATDVSRKMHLAGWEGCLEGLAQLLG